ncbi:uncharacterized protein Bfra_009954, partial [Botrytis fragariae]
EKEKDRLRYISLEDCCQYLQHCLDEERLNHHSSIHPSNSYLNPFISKSASSITPTLQNAHNNHLPPHPPLFPLYPLSISAIPTPAPAPASKTTKEDLSYLAELFASDSLARSQFPLADPSTNKKVCGRAYARKETDTAFFGKQCCCMFLHTKDGAGGKRKVERINGGGLVGDCWSTGRGDWG